MLKTTSIAAAIALSFTPSAFAEAFVVCQAPDHSDIILEIEAAVFDGVAISCISSDFAYDMTPCAPTNGYGLSAPTGAASLVGLVYDWREYGDHMGGVVEFSESPSSYRFQGGFQYPGSGYEEAWSFLANRLSGEGTLTIVQEVEEDGSVGRSSQEFACRAAKQQF